MLAQMRQHRNIANLILRSFSEGGSLDSDILLFTLWLWSGGAKRQQINSKINPP